MTNSESPSPGDEVFRLYKEEHSCGKITVGIVRATVAHMEMSEGILSYAFKVGHVCGQDPMLLYLEEDLVFANIDAAIAKSRSMSFETTK